MEGRTRILGVTARNTLEIARTEFAILLRETGWIAGVAIVGWLGLVLVQEPPFIRRFGLAFAGPSVQAGCLFVVAAVPVVWSLSRMDGAAFEWWRRTVGPLPVVLGAWLGLALVGMGLSLLAAVAWITLESMNRGQPQWTDGALLVVRATMIGAVLSALAPGVARVGGTAAGVTATWLIVIGGSLALPSLAFPLPLSRLIDVDGDHLLGAGLTASLATSAGLAASMSVFRRA